MSFSSFSRAHGKNRVEDITLIQRVGKGSFGEVYEAIDRGATHTLKSQHNSGASKSFNNVILPILYNKLDSGIAMPIGTKNLWGVVKNRLKIY